MLHSIILYSNILILTVVEYNSASVRDRNIKIKLLRIYYSTNSIKEYNLITAPKIDNYANNEKIYIWFYLFYELNIEWTRLIYKYVATVGY